MPASSPAGKATENEAKKILEGQGYQVMRAATPGPFDLIAWKDPSKILCLCIRRSKLIGISGYAETIRDLAGLVRTDTAPGECQFWIRFPSVWMKFQILPGGALLIEEGNYGRDPICS